MSNIIKYAKRFMAKFSGDNVPLLAAAQAYYYLLSIVPLLIVCFALIPYFHIDSNQAISFISDSIPGEMASILKDNIINLVETPRGGLLTVGIIGALWSASNAINAFVKSSNQAYGVEETRPFILVRLLGLGLTLGMIVALVVAIILPVFGDVILEFLQAHLGFSGAFAILFQVLRWVLSLVILSTLLMMLYRLAPNKRMPLKHIIPGALTAAILWQLISLGFSFYVSNFGNYTATYGSLGGIIVLMIWFFLTGMILMIGAIVNVLYHEDHKEADTEQIKASNM
ncbi:membrane protein [Virgibacillus halotolerans]|uniref:YihY/virulence factor BrkB family protein n=1 Tax=Virgibacillus halotolerans TaxID=1071053 RepID=UPI0019611B00|nr:YihY/virulence factor BrkB family protein [Virgibacillus halotolerans]MBM7601831.1 membrane protein [Virgibacillus halotolerans]